jgi:hypothetical protein
MMENYIKSQISQVSGVKNIQSFTIEKISNDTEVYFKIDTVVIYDGDVLEISEIIGN